MCERPRGRCDDGAEDFRGRIVGRAGGRRVGSEAAWLLRCAEEVAGGADVRRFLLKERRSGVGMRSSGQTVTGPKERDRAQWRCVRNAWKIVDS